jgi:hypothetical protein
LLVAEEEFLLLDDAADPLGGVQSLWLVHAQHHQQELLPAVAPDELLLAHRVREQRGELSEQIVAGDMPIGVVVVLEVIDVEEEHRDRARGAGGRLHRVLDPPEQMGRLRRPVRLSVLARFRCCFT